MNAKPQPIVERSQNDYGLRMSVKQAIGRQIAKMVEPDSETIEAFASFCDAKDKWFRTVEDAARKALGEHVY